MSFLGLVLAALLALAIPASIAHASLVGAYVVIALLGGSGAGYVVRRSRRRRWARPKLNRWLARLGTLIAAYAVVVTLIHGVG
ncbi:MAG: hypothetical protein ABI345_01005 [Jatrophihabitans sp.]